MLRSAKELEGYAIHATDGDIGKVDEFYFDDESWSVQYLVVDTAKWLPGRKTLLAPVSLSQPNWAEHIFPVSLTKDQVKSSPGIEEHLPISRQFQMKLHAHYGWPIYWSNAGFEGYEPIRPAVMIPQMEEKSEEEDSSELSSSNEDSHLQSVDDILGYRINASDGMIGHVTDFIVDDETWSIRYLVIDTKEWFTGKKVLIPPQWVLDVEWSKETIVVDHTQDEIMNSPEFDPYAPVNRIYEERLYDYYGRPVYWKKD